MTDVEGGEDGSGGSGSRPVVDGGRRPRPRPRILLVAPAAFAAALVCLALAVRPSGHVTAPKPVATPSAPDVASAVVNIEGAVAGGVVRGTGMLIDRTGVVLTNNHVVAGTTRLAAQVAGDGPVYTAVVLGVDPTHDVAVIRLEHASGLPTVVIDASGAVSVGERVTGMGNALGRNGRPVSATGAVTSLDEAIDVREEGAASARSLDGMICFDAPIQPGDSGGPLLNTAQRVIGMDTAGSAHRASTATGSWGCAIPITRAVGIARDILAGARGPYIEGAHSGELGLTVSDANGGSGVRIATVTTGEAGSAGGMAPGDVLTDIADIAITSAADYDEAMRGRRPGDVVSVTWCAASGAPHQAMITLSPGPPA